MGYTHYWRNPEGFSDEEWAVIKHDTEALFKNLPEHSHSSGDYYGSEPLAIDDQNGGPPVVDEDIIWFNGTGALSYETFVLYRKPEKFSFCKTARKPYDLVVQAVLLIARLAKPSLYVASDGEPEDWETAAELVRNMTGMCPDLTFLKL